VQIQLLIF